MVSNQLIAPEREQDYTYAMQTLLEMMISVGSILMISFFLHALLPTVFFLMTFFSLRRRTGGYHAKTFLVCYIETIGSYLLVYSFNLLWTSKGTWDFYLLGAANAVIWIIGTVNHPAMHMNKQELSQSKMAARIVLFMETGIIIFLHFVQMNVLMIHYMISGILLCAVLMLLAKLCQQEV
jgi:accessory gene regulator B